MKKLNKGFTLVELIVVITILAVLATIAFITLGDYPVQARDSKRAADLRQIATKISALQAEWTSLSDFVKDKASAPEITWLTLNTWYTKTKSYSWEIDFGKLKENGDKFKDPKNQAYKIMVIEWTETASGKKFSCFELAATWEITPKFVEWNCKVYASAKTYSTDTGLLPYNF